MCTEHDDILIVDWRPDLPRDTLLVFNEHARERVTGELALEVIDRLTQWNPNRRVTIIPILNVWGRKHVEAGYPCTRKNENGVDPNRNYQMVEHKYSWYSEEYEGEHPLSEKESQLVSSLLMGVRRYVNVHSGEFSLYMPYDGRVDRPPNAEIMENNLRRWAKYCLECTVGQAAKKSFYKAYGTSCDWAIAHGVLEAYTFEIYGNNAYSCVSMFNPRKLQLTFETWLPIMKDVLST
jgi:hypothetical protein